MYQATVLFDFDSTVIQGESFELMLQSKLRSNLEVLSEIENLTQLAMTGKISFSYAVKKRFTLASPTIKDIDHFIGHSMPSIISRGFKELIRKLQSLNIDVWIISGGLKRVIDPFAQFLGIELQKVIALEGLWNKEGNFIKIIENESLISKVLATKQYQLQWQKPVFIVGDGFTDYELKKENIADYFIGYTEHVKREEVIKFADLTADSAEILEKLIFKKIKKQSA